MRASTALLISTLFVAGCLHEASRPRGDVLAFNVHSSDVVSARAETIDPSHLDTREGTPHFEAQLHLVLNDSGVRRFQRFGEAHNGQTFELQINGEVLLTGVGASQLRGGNREMYWFVSSMDEAKHFAVSLHTK